MFRTATTRTTTRVRTRKMVRRLDAIIVHVAQSLTMSCAGVGLQSPQNQKRKRPAHPSADTRSDVEVENTADDDILPRVQDSGNRPIYRTTLPAQSDPQVTAPHYSPSPPHSVLGTEDEITRLDKPMPKLTVKALRNAKAEVHRFTCQTHEPR